MVHFEGETTDLSKKQLDFIASVLQKEGYEDARVTIKPVGEVGGNFVASVVRITAEKDGKIFKMIAKVAPTIEQVRVNMKTHVFFHNEFIMYSRVLSKFTEIEEAAEIPQSERLRYAKFYGAFMEEPMEMILLEDLQVPGFVLLDRFKPLPNDAIKLILKSFARLHSRSYVLNNQEPDTYNEFKNALADVWLILIKDDNAMQFYKSTENDAVTVLISDKHKSIVKRHSGKRAEILNELTATDYDNRYSVILQGDSWINNMMFILEGATPTECCMIDYQISRISSPAADLHYMIFTSTDYESRAKHFHEWIDYYHSELDKNLLEFGLKSDHCYPREQLDADLKRHAKFSLSNAILLSSVTIRESGNAAQMKETIQNMGDANTDVNDLLKASSITEASESTRALFRTRVAGVIDSFLELGYMEI